MVSRTIRRAITLKFQRLEEYLLFAMADRSEARILLNSITTNVSEFFRDSQQLGFLKELVSMTDIRATINLLSAGCSTGEEAYSLAMIFLDAGRNFRLDGIDVNDEVLETAARGIYPHSKLAGLPAGYVKRFFDPVDGGMAAKPILKERLRFVRCNVLADQMPGEVYDVVLCKNVLIYFRPENKKIAIRNLGNRLKAGGYLVLGSSETLIGLQEDSFDYSGKNIYRKRDPDEEILQ